MNHPLGKCSLWRKHFGRQYTPGSSRLHSITHSPFSYYSYRIIHLFYPQNFAWEFFSISPGYYSKSSQGQGKRKQCLCIFIYLFFSLVGGIGERSVLWGIRYLHISHSTPCLSPQILHNLCFSFVLGIIPVPRSSKRNWKQCLSKILRG